MSKKLIEVVQINTFVSRCEIARYERWRNLIRSVRANTMQLSPRNSDTAVDVHVQSGPKNEKFTFMRHTFLVVTVHGKLLKSVYICGSYRKISQN